MRKLIPLLLLAASLPACVENRIVNIDGSEKTDVREKSERSNAPEGPTQGPRIRGGDGR